MKILQVNKQAKSIALLVEENGRVYCKQDVFNSNDILGMNIDLLRYIGTYKDDEFIELTSPLSLFKTLEYIYGEFV